MRALFAGGAGRRLHLGLGVLRGAAFALAVAACAGTEQVLPPVSPASGAASGAAASADLGVAGSGNAQPSTEPTHAVARFLEASARRDLSAMARSFGTRDGPVANTGGALRCGFRKVASWAGLADPCPSRSDVELRMDLLATLLTHSAFEIRSEEPVAGRRHPAVRVTVDLSAGGRTVTGVPFVVVRSASGAWLIQEVALERLTG